MSLKSQLPPGKQTVDPVLSQPQDCESATMRKVAWRLVPFLCLIYVVAFIDRINIGFAALTMSKDLGLTPAMFGLGAGIFFIGYFLFEVPSNLILHRVGARRWIARVMITWGIISSCFTLIHSPASFFLLRFLLGVAEAGFFPGIILYLSFWFPKRWRGQVTAGFMSAIPVASFIAAPLSGVLLQMNGIAGFKGWQWMFIVEGLPSVILGFVVLKFLTDTPAKAKWLKPQERDWLVKEMAAETGPAQRHSLKEVLGTLISWKVMQLALVYFGLTTGLYGIELWMPQMLKGFGLSDLQVGFVSAIPYLVAICTMGSWAKHSDKTGERYWHVAVACAVGGGGLLLAGLLHDYPMLVVLLLSLAIAGVMAARPPFWAMPSDFLTGQKAAAGIAAINSVGNLGGFLGPFLIGWARQATGSFIAGLMISAVTLLVSAMIVISLRRSAKLSILQPTTQP
jgi:ACS family tartrate transporter-like MFS transporter